MYLLQARAPVKVDRYFEYPREQLHNRLSRDVVYEDVQRQFVDFKINTLLSTMYISNIFSILIS
jgi:hypothetical protein